MKISLMELNRANKIFVRKSSKGNNYAKAVDGVTVLLLCTLSDGGLYLNHVS